jgi:hypothetical protein
MWLPSFGSESGQVYWSQELLAAARWHEGRCTARALILLFSAYFLPRGSAGRHGRHGCARADRAAWDVLVEGLCVVGGCDSPLVGEVAELREAASPGGLTGRDGEIVELAARG